MPFRETAQRAAREVWMRATVAPESKLGQEAHQDRVITPPPHAFTRTELLHIFPEAFGHVRKKLPRRGKARVSHIRREGGAATH